ncbi:MAG: hypothetical protein AAF645_23485 [Myxococcota bacterium]
MMKHLALIAALFCAAPALTHAQVNQAGVARQLSADALSAAQNGNWERAADLFQQSYDLAPRPLTLYNLASAQLNVGRLVDADENFRRFLRETAPGQHDQFRTEAASAREALASRIAYVSITVEGLSANDIVQLDGTNLSAAVMGRAVPVDPGSHNVRVRRGGTIIEQQEFTASEGQTSTLELEVPPSRDISPADAAATTNVGGGGETGGTAEESKGISPVVWVVVGVVAAAGLAVGAYFIFREEDPDPFQSPNGIGGDGLIRF